MECISISDALVEFLKVVSCLFSCVFLTMEKQGKMLSLGEWPTRPHNRYGSLSPITKRILNQVHIDPQDIMPLAFQQFLQNHTHSSHNKEQL